MRINPAKRQTAVEKANSDQEKINRLTRKAAIIISFLIIYFFFIKLLFL